MKAYDEHRERAIALVFERGMTREMAARLVNVPYLTVCRWCAKHAGAPYGCERRRKAGAARRVVREKIARAKALREAAGGVVRVEGLPR